MKSHLSLIKPDPGVTERTRAELNKLRRETLELVRRIDRDYIELGRRLWQIVNDPGERDGEVTKDIYKSWRNPSTGRCFETFQEYVQEELGLHPRKAYRLRAVYRRLFVDLDELSNELRTRITDLGFGRVRELIRVLTVDNAEEWVARAENWTYWKTYQAVVAYLTEKQEALERAARVGAELEAEDAVSQEVFERITEEVERQQFPRHFSFFPEQLEIIDQAVERASQISCSDIKSYNLYLICLEYLGTNYFTRPSREQTLRWWARLEQACRESGLRLVIVDSDTHDVAYGLDTFADALEKFQERMRIGKEEVV